MNAIFECPPGNIEAKTKKTFYEEVLSRDPFIVEIKAGRFALRFLVKAVRIQFNRLGCQEGKDYQIQG